ncbi:uncharacterized protein [Chlorocebus sabaeus]|uniref:uncharacterized protein isoform X1 n=1 Tax=Chlorocebus sabaeus TaxID=60711 RepID=UPI003BF95377
MPFWLKAQTTSRKLQGKEKAWSLILHFREQGPTDFEVAGRNPGDRGLSRRYRIGEESLGVPEVDQKELGKNRWWSLWPFSLNLSEISDSLNPKTTVVPQLSTEDWFQDSHGSQNPRMLRIPYIKWHSICI